MLGDIQIYDEGAFGYPGDVEWSVASGTTASINAGEPVARALGAAVVTAAGDGTPVLATDYLAGIAATTSTETASAAGTVKVMKIVGGVTYLGNPKDSTLWDTQAEYDALVGDRVVFDLTSGTYTIDSVDGATNGLVVMPLDIAKHPGKVRFAFRDGVDELI